ncbi:MAG: ABC transporter permease [Acidobacteria bacterium]|nr:ABC transporter permease [Acidobacteriota bacterium]
MLLRIRSYREAIAQGVSSALAQPLRAGLGALAVAVAVATIVVVVTALDGLARYARTTGARAFGSDTFLLAQIATSGQSSRRDLAEKQERNPAIRRSDLRFLERYAGRGIISASTVQRTGQVTAGAMKYENAAISGATATLAELRDLGLARGRFLQRDEDLRGAQVAVIGADVAETLFPAGEALGGFIRIAGRRFEVIGVQLRLGSSGGTSLDRFVWMPITTFERLYGQPPTLSIFAKAREAEETVAAEGTARAALRARRQLAPAVADNFDLLTPEAARDFVLRVSERVGAAAAPISAMALLAAIVVITNTTLVSVTQKTREIGVRRALGATRRQIMGEVVAESTVVSIAGGVAGTLLTAAAVSVLARFASLDVVVKGSTMAWAIGAAAVSGLAAGYYPARRATRIDVIAAVRVE